MCGICGIVDFRKAPERDLLTRMIAALAHRGPDGSGLFRDKHVALGHTRLAVIDHAGGAQPMRSPDADLWITYNGEIFNYVELADELRGLGHRFVTASDTEVILHAWQQWGAECFQRFNGQWALGIWDAGQQTLTLARDPLGVRPLFYAERAGALHFASEIKSLFADPAIPRELSPAGLDEVMTFWAAIAPTTAFRGIRQLPPGHYARFDRAGLRITEYFQPDLQVTAGPDPRENAELLRHALIDAARLRFLRSDVPVGAYLSGGIDSSVIAAIVARYTDVPLRTFSLRFADAAFDEGRYQHEMADRLGTVHREITVTPADIGEVFPDVVLAAETPLLRTAPAPLYLLSRLVRDEGFKVVVTGEGADEVLAGYDIFREAKVRQFWARDPDSHLRARASELLYPWMVNSPGRVPAFAHGFFTRNLDPADPGMSHRTRWDSTSALKGMLSPAFRTGTDTAAELLASMPPAVKDWDVLGRAQWLEMRTLLPGYILSSQGDRMLMAHSVEGRFPFLDRNLVALANGLPGEQKMLGLQEKYLLKQAFGELVPENILKRPKQPYRAPDAASFLTATEWFDDVTSPSAIAQAGVFQPRAVEALLAKCRRSDPSRLGNTDTMRLSAVVSTQLLDRDLVRGWRPPDAGPPLPFTVHDRLEERDS